jgi:hypothetical protein
MATATATTDTSLATTTTPTTATTTAPPFCSDPLVAVAKPTPTRRGRKRSRCDMANCAEVNCTHCMHKGMTSSPDAVDDFDGLIFDPDDNFDDLVLDVGTDFEGDGSTLTDSGCPRVFKSWNRGTPISEAVTAFEAEQTDVAGHQHARHDRGIAVDDFGGLVKETQQKLGAQEQEKRVTPGMKRESHLLPILKDITVDQLRCCFHMPITEAARHFGKGTTWLKEVCRRLNIKQWPCRQIHKIGNGIHSMQVSLHKADTDAKRQLFKGQIGALKTLLKSVMDDPNCPPVAFSINNKGLKIRNQKEPIELTHKLKAKKDADAAALKLKTEQEEERVRLAKLKVTLLLVLVGMGSGEWVVSESEEIIFKKTN